MLTIEISGAELKAMLAFASEDEPVMAGLCVCPDGRLMTTDGQALVVRGAGPRHDTSGRRLIPTAALKEAVRAKHVVISVDGEEARIDADGATRTASLAPDIPPPFEQIFPTDLEALATIGLNPQHIGRVAVIDKVLGNKGGSTWAFEFYGALEPVVASKGAWSVVIMPNRL